MSKLRFVLIGFYLAWLSSDMIFAQADNSWQVKDIENIQESIRRYKSHSMLASFDILTSMIKTEFESLISKKQFDEVFTSIFELLYRQGEFGYLEEHINSVPNNNRFNWKKMFILLCKKDYQNALVLAKQMVLNDDSNYFHKKALCLCYYLCGEIAQCERILLMIKEIIAETNQKSSFVKIMMEVLSSYEVKNSKLVKDIILESGHFDFIDLMLIKNSKNRLISNHMKNIKLAFGKNYRYKNEDIYTIALMSNCSNDLRCEAIKRLPFINSSLLSKFKHVYLSDCPNNNLSADFKRSYHSTSLKSAENILMSALGKNSIAFYLYPHVINKIFRSGLESKFLSVSTDLKNGFYNFLFNTMRVLIANSRYDLAINWMQQIKYFEPKKYNESLKPIVMILSGSGITKWRKMHMDYANDKIRICNYIFVALDNIHTKRIQNNGIANPRADQVDMKKKFGALEIAKQVQARLERPYDVNQAVKLIEVLKSYNMPYEAMQIAIEFINNLYTKD